MKLKSVTFLLTFLICVSFKPETDKDSILWKENRPLTWDDFKGKPERRFAAASTSYDILKDITKETNKTATVEIEAVFFCETSWKKSQWVNEQVLQHEQKHFDIVELYARKLRKTISETTFESFSDLKTNIETLYDANDKAMDAYQDKYDDETDGSMNGEQQRIWMKKIMAEIKELDAYKETTLQISFSK